MLEQPTKKRAIKCAISFGVYLVSGAVTFVLRLARVKRRGTCVVLYYHSVPPEQRSLFARQLDTLLRHAKPVRVDQQMELQAGSHTVGVTFDDGFENFAEIALPELAKRNIPSAVFLIAGAVGKSFGPVDHMESVMTPRQVRALPPDLVTVGSHTVSHPFLPSLSETQARAELAQSKQTIQALIGREVRLFSFPFGGFSKELVKLCGESGYQRVFTTLPQVVRGAMHGFVVGRVRVDPTDWPIEFRLKLAGAYRWLPVAFRVKRMLASNPIVLRLSGRREKENRRLTPPGIGEQFDQPSGQSPGQQSRSKISSLPVS